MDLLKQTKQLCHLYQIKPARSRGQNFLISENVYDKIIKAAELNKDDVVLEVGPGLGFLTTKLAGGANGRSPVQRVIAVELDKKLVEILKIKLAGQNIKNVEVVNEDILRIDTPLTRGVRGVGFEKRQEPPLIPPYQGGESRGFKIVANLPYNITSIFLRKFLSAEIKPELMVLMLQKEVAERICARPPKMSLLAVSVQFYAVPEIITHVPKENFWSEPEVDSAMIKLHIAHRVSPIAQSQSKISAKGAAPAIASEAVGRGSASGGENRLATPDLLVVASPDLLRSETKRDKSEMYLGVDKERDFFRLVKFGFSSKRKMLKNNLAAGFKISPAEAENKLKLAGFNAKIRAQELSVNDWLKLFGVFKENMV